MNKFALRSRLSHDVEFLQLCLLRLYEQQEADEQGARSTWHENGVGFNKADGSVLSVYCETLLSGHPLTSEQLRDATTRMNKYTNQLATLLNEDEIG